MNSQPRDTTAPPPPSRREQLTVVQDVAETLGTDPRDYSPVISDSRWASFRYALSGWAYMLRYQKNTRLQAAASAIVLLVGLWLEITPGEWAVIILSIALVWMAEFVNAAIEAAVNLASPELHPMAKIGKDVAAAAVLLGVVASVLVGLLIFGPPLLTRLQGLVG